MSIRDAEISHVSRVTSAVVNSDQKIEITRRFGSVEHPTQADTTTVRNDYFNLICRSSGGILEDIPAIIIGMIAITIRRGE